MKRFATVMMSVLALGLSGGRAFGTNPPHSPDDHFLCLKVKDATVPKFAGAPTMLSDQFESGPFNVVKDKGLCAPANKNGEGVVDPNTHLVSYTVKAAGTVTASAVPRTDIKVVNQFHTITSPIYVDISKGDRLLVPANKSLVSDPTAPNLMSINVDHYRCYKAKYSKTHVPAQPKFTPITVDMPGIQTQFDTAPQKYTLKKVSHLCAPVAVGAGTIKNSLGHLVCYKASLQSGGTAPAATHVFTHDEFAGLVMDTGKVAEFCVPSLKNTNPVCGNGILEPGEVCDGTEGACPGQCYSDVGVCTCPGMHVFSLGTVGMGGTSTSNQNARGTFGHDSDLSVGPLAGSITLVAAAEAPPGSGVVPLAVLPTVFPQVLFAGQKVCGYLVDQNDGSGTAGGGAIKCGSVDPGVPLPPSSDFRLFKDHCTQATSPVDTAPRGCNSGNLTGNCAVSEFSPLPGTNHPGAVAGEPAVCVTTLSPDDTCTAMSPTGSKAVREVGHCSITTTQLCNAILPPCPMGEVCLGHCSDTTTTTCSMDIDCPLGETCDDPNVHDGACNSPTYFVPGNGTGAPSWASQATFLRLNLLIKVQSTNCSPHPGKCSPSGTGGIGGMGDCDKDTDCTVLGDTCNTGASLQPFTTTSAVSGVMDWDAMTTTGVCDTMTNLCTTGTSSTGSCTMNSDCRVAVGQVQALPLNGVNFSCASLLNSTTAGAKVVSSLPALDILNPILSVYHDLDVGVTFAAK